MLSRPDEAFRFASDVCGSPASVVSRWKMLSGRKAAGCVPLYLPEEVLHAAGMLPVTVWGNEYLPVPPGDVSSPACSVAGGILTSFRSGRWAVMDAWAFPSACDTLRDAFETMFPPAGAPPRFSFAFPAGAVPGASEDLLDRVEAFREWAGEVSGWEVSEGSLERSLRTYNENRDAFALVEERMADSPGWISGREYHALAGAGMALPKEIHTRVLRAAASRKRPSAGGGRAKVFLCGTMATFPLMDALDGAGAAIVGNDLGFGHRYYAGTADVGGDMSVSLVRRHFRRDPCLALHGGGPGCADRLLRRVSECGADRVLLLRMPQCGRGSDESEFADVLRERGIPFLLLDVDLDAADRSSAALRIEPFVGMGK